MGCLRGAHFPVRMESKVVFLKRKVFYAALLAAGAFLGLYGVFAAKAEDIVLLAVCICWFTAVFGFMFEMNRFFSYYQGNYEEEYSKSLEQGTPPQRRVREFFEFHPEGEDQELTQRQADIKLYVKFFLTSGIAAGAVLWILQIAFLD